MLTKEQKAFFESLENLAKSRGVKLYLVGGFVRDLLLSSFEKLIDVDLLMEGDPEPLARDIALKVNGYLKEFKDFLTFKVESPVSFPALREIDIARARKETYTAPGALPTVSPAGFLNDFSRRDFSINAMALCLGDFLGWISQPNLNPELLYPKVVNPFSGMEDLNNKLIRVLHEKSFIDDPTRIFRACRYGGRLNFEIEENTKTLLAEALKNGALNTISTFRIVNEFKKAAYETNPALNFRKLSELGVLKALSFLDQAKLDLFDEGIATLFDSRSSAIESQMLYKKILCLAVSCSKDPPNSPVLNEISLTRQERREILEALSKKN